MKTDKYQKVIRTITALTADENDILAIMSTVCCELYHAFDHFNWVGFYRLVDPTTLKVGPYQGGHGCLSIDINCGVCGQCVREQSIQLVNDVNAIPHHIACSSKTKSEIVLPIRNDQDLLTAVLDIDSTTIGTFDEIDKKYLQLICNEVERGYLR